MDASEKSVDSAPQPSIVGYRGKGGGAGDGPEGGIGGVDGAGGAALGGSLFTSPTFSAPDTVSLPPGWTTTSARVGTPLLDERTLSVEDSTAPSMLVKPKATSMPLGEAPPSVDSGAHASRRRRSVARIS